MSDTPNLLDPVFQFYLNMGSTLAAALIGGVLCALVVLFFPQRIRLARDTISTVPGHAALVGGLSFLGVVAASIIYGLSLILILPLLFLPVAFAVWLGTLVLFIAGAVVVAEPFGHWLLRKRGIHVVPMAAAAVGGFILSLGMLLLGWLPICGVLADLFGAVAVAMGAGGLILTRLGSREYPEKVVAGDSPSARLV